MSTRLEYIKPENLIRAADLIEKDSDPVAASEIVIKLKEIQNAISAPYEREEQKIEVLRAQVSERLLALLEAVNPGVKAGSVLHIDTSVNVLRLLVDLNGLQKPVNKKPDIKIATKIELKFGKPRERD